MIFFFPFQRCMFPPHAFCGFPVIVETTTGTEIRRLEAGAGHTLGLTECHGRGAELCPDIKLIPEENQEVRVVF